MLYGTGYLYVGATKHLVGESNPYLLNHSATHVGIGRGTTSRHRPYGLYLWY